MEDLNVDAKSYKETIEQIWNKVVITLGPMTTVVILKKVISETQNKYPFMKQLEVNEEGINFNHLKIKNKEELQQGFEDLINNLFGILTNLTGDVLVREIKKELATFS